MGTLLIIMALAFGLNDFLVEQQVPELAVQWILEPEPHAGAVPVDGQRFPADRRGVDGFDLGDLGDRSVADSHRRRRSVSTRFTWGSFSS